MTMFPYDITQNPGPTPETGQEFQQQKRALADAIMATFYKVLPSNYVASERGPWYTMQFQAIAEQLAEFQLNAQQIYKDSDWNFTRPEFLFEVLGTLVFPGATAQKGFLQIDGDITFRDFLKGMVLVLLKGSTPAALEEGAGLITDSTVILIEKFLDSIDRNPGGAWTIDDQFAIELFIETAGGTAFPPDPFSVQNSLALVMEALKPAHVIYEASFLFRDAFGEITDTSSWALSAYYYDDLRKFCYGVKEIVGTAGVTLTDRTLFTDTSKSLGNVRPGAVLRVTSGSNAGNYDVTDVRAFPYGNDAISRGYTTSPTGLTGSVVVSGDVLTDDTQNFALAVEGEVLTIASGPNAGSYRLDTLMGSKGGPLGSVTAVGPATSVQVSPCILRVSRRMPVTATGQSYSVDVDRLGVRTPKTITAENVSEQFYL